MRWKCFSNVAMLAIMMLIFSMPMNGAVRKLCLTGAHGCGKSTLAYGICAELKRRGFNAIVISETARESPFPFGKGQPIEATFFIALQQAVKELEAIARGYNYLILDRGVCDPFIYSIANSEGSESKLEHSLRKAFVEWMKSYDEIFFIKCSEGHALENDGVRDMNADFAVRVQDVLDEFLKRNFPDKTKTFLYDDVILSDIHIAPNGEVILGCHPLEEK